MVDFIIRALYGSKFIHYPRTIKIFIIISLFVFALITFYSTFYFLENLKINKEKIKDIAFILSLLLIVGGFVLNYLNKNLKETSKVDEIQSIKNEFSHIYKLIRKNDLGRSINSLNINPEERVQLLDSIRLNLEKDINLSYLSQLKGMINNSNLEEILETKITSTYQRLNLERESLSRRGNFNLTIGMFLSVGGLIVMGSSVLNYNHTSIEELLIFIIPKISFVLLIELFAYFFLNLYKKSLEDIKYYQNEITNMEAKYLALQMAKSLNNHKTISSILEQLVKTERNFILEKDQSTIEIEKERISSNNTNNTLQILKDIFKSKV
ncbi:hypothetical protein [Acinetobacter pittii]|uniref:hypothetical protein n=1 Tax=Acinetobacter pittii TaxID=48296 RepID=UPI000699C1E6|nr:hypothetical protein [Acinetobacter pittii]TGU85687.1 hypothetical protein YA64_016020 [Acinetobacter pittii]